MKNRERYILQRNEYDLMLDMIENMKHGTHCAIRAISGSYEYGRCLKYSYQCKNCCQEWLNEETKEKSS